MTDRARNFEGKPLERVADAMADCQAGSQVDQMAKAEFMLRQTEAQVSAARATEETARATKAYTRYMLWSVVVLALSALASLVLNVASLVSRR